MCITLRANVTKCVKFVSIANQSHETREFCVALRTNLTKRVNFVSLCEQISRNA
jgi:hypothetical protein